MKRNFQSFEQAKIRIDAVISIYNSLRPHLSCAMKTPQQVHAEDNYQHKIRQCKPNSGLKIVKQLKPIIKQ